MSSAGAAQPTLTACFEFRHAGEGPASSARQGRYERRSRAASGPWHGTPGHHSPRLPLPAGPRVDLGALCERGPGLARAIEQQRPGLALLRPDKLRRPARLDQAARPDSLGPLNLGLARQCRAPRCCVQLCPPLAGAPERHLERLVPVLWARQAAGPGGFPNGRQRFWPMARQAARRWPALHSACPCPWQPAWWKPWPAEPPAGSNASTYLRSKPLRLPSALTFLRQIPKALGPAPALCPLRPGVAPESRPIGPPSRWQRVAASALSMGECCCCGAENPRQ